MCVCLCVCVCMYVCLCVGKMPTLWSQIKRWKWLNCIVVWTQSSWDQSALGLRLTLRVCNGAEQSDSCGCVRARETTICTGYCMQMGVCLCELNFFWLYHLAHPAPNSQHRYCSRCRAGGGGDGGGGGGRAGMRDWGRIRCTVRLERFACWCAVIAANSTRPSTSKQHKSARERRQRRRRRT